MNGSDKIAERRAYVEGFNTVMVQIWQEQITQLDVVDKGLLLSSIANSPIKADGRYLDLSMTYSFNHYGIYQDRGTGKEVAKGNSGDIGRDKVRVAKPWFSRKLTSSKYNLRDFMAESLGEEFTAIMIELNK